ncbi:MAG: hypothetical protein IT201_10705 [Thermoleophilia bacterium]|nr:hypothetical protein [Thermoleophilia bacterium]
MEPSEALADLIEISTQIRAAVIVAPGGDVISAAGADGDQARDLARGARELVAAAADAMGGSESRERLAQIQAAMPQGSVFVVQDEERLVAAVTVAEPTVGLVFYDLKTCLRHVAGESLAPKPRPRAAGTVEPTPGTTDEAPAGEQAQANEEEDGTP